MSSFVQSMEPQVSEEVIKRLHHITVRNFQSLEIKVPYADKRIYLLRHRGWRYELEHPHIVRARNKKTNTNIVINFETDETTQLSKVMLEIIHKIISNSPQ